MTYQMTTLSNGLRVASETLPGVESVSVVVSVGCGARNESLEENGISHLLEHMAFKGTSKRNAREISEAFDAVGGQTNAYTSMEATVYFAKVLKQDTELAVDILGDILQNSVFDPEELKREQNVILQEIAMHRDTPEDLINDYFDEVAFPGQPLGRPILSNEKQVMSYRRDDLIRYMDTHYRPPRMVLSAAGKIDHTQLVELAEKYFSLPKRPAGPAYEEARYAGGDRRVKRDLGQMHLLLGLPAVPVNVPEYYMLQLYNNILGGSMSSRLFQEVREKRGLAYSVYASGSSYEDCGLTTIYAATSPDKAKELSAVLCDQLVAMTQSVGEEELVRAKNQIKAELLMARESPQTVASWIGRHLLVFNEYRHVQDIAQRIDAVSTDDIVRLAKHIASGTLTIGALGDVSGLLPYDELASRLKAA